MKITVDARAAMKSAKEFNFRLFHSISEQLADNGIHIVRKEDS